ncbi:MAG: SGNH/GDSL hydrolase family protein [Hyphomicrobiaceae bacterium]
MPSRMRLLGLTALLIVATLAHALAQAVTNRASFIDPFPKGEIYKLHLVGDWFADGVRSVLSATLTDTGQIQTQSSVIQVRSLRRASWDNAVSRIEQVGRRDAMDIAVVMFGAAEAGSLSVPGRRRVRFGTESWKSQYIRRVDRAMKALRKTGTAVYWLGMPTLGRSDRNQAAQFINEIFRERAYINGVKYIDTYTGFADENGNYSPYGPDLTGKIRLLRTKDGVYFTGAGYRKLAHFAEREIRRDLRKAKSERKVPLAGSELEQQRVNPRRAQQAAVAKDSAGGQQKQRPRAVPRIGSDTVSAPSPVRQVPGLKDQKADDGVIALRTIENGIARIEKVKLIRPAISANVLALLTRKQSTSQPARLGDNVAVELPGGFIALSSITTASTSGPGARLRSLSPTQSPFFKVWAKGERLTPRKGRADDIEWPRPEPLPVQRTALRSPQSDAPARNGEIAIEDSLPPLPEPNPRAR